MQESEEESKWKYVVLSISATGPDGQEWHVTMQTLDPLVDQEHVSHFWFLLREAVRELSQYVGIYGTWEFAGVYSSTQFTKPPRVRLTD